MTLMIGDTEKWIQAIESIRIVLCHVLESASTHQAAICN